MEPTAEIRDDHAKFFFIGLAVSLDGPFMFAPCDFGYGQRQLLRPLRGGNYARVILSNAEYPPHPLSAFPLLIQIVILRCGISLGEGFFACP
jgi:hypothetical protein